MLLNIAVVKGNPFITAVFGKEFAHHAFRKKSLVDVPIIIPDIPSQFSKEFRLSHRERDIRKAGFTFEFGRNGKADEDAERNMLVIAAFVRQGSG